MLQALPASRGANASRRVDLKHASVKRLSGSLTKSPTAFWLG